MSAQLRAFSEIREARRLLARLSTADLARLELATPPVSYWSRLLVTLLRTERLRRRELDWHLEDLVALAPTGTVR